MHIKYSKPLTDNFLKIKESFYNENKQNVKKAKKVASFYIKQKIRKKCIICFSKIGNPVIINLGIGYSICDKCGHLNGERENTIEFNNWYYSNKKGKNYSSVYNHNYSLRVKNIYEPKVNFLLECLKKNKFKEQLEILDIGSGTGCFLKALENKKIKANGYEPNEMMVNFGISKLKSNKLRIINLGEEKKIIVNSNANVLSMIGVLEHVKDPIETLKIYKKSNIKYLYLSLPLFSLSCFLENIFPNIYPRQLSLGHNHLFTHRSINYFVKKFKFKIIGEWWFGQEISDLYRSITNSRDTKNEKAYNHLLKEYLADNINEIQSIIDKKKQSSEVHLLLKKN